MRTRSTISENSDGSIKSVSSFGKGFVAPQKRVQHNTSFVVKSKNNQANAEARKKQEEEKLKDLLENNPIKKMLLERKQREAQEASKTNIEQTTSTPNITNNTLKSGDRVFHSKYGVGKIVDIKEFGESSMYIVDFGSQGQKALDAAFAQLKKF